MRRKTGRLAACAAMALIIALGLALAGRADAGGRGQGRHGHEQGGGKKAMRVLGRLAQDPALQKRLGLDDPQVSRLGALWSETRSTLGRQKGAIAQQKAELHALIADPDASRRAIEAKGSDLIRARGEIEREVLGAFLDARDVLTPEQRTALRQVLREHRGKRADRYGEDEVLPDRGD